MKFDNVVIVLGKRLIDNRLSTEGVSRVRALVDAVESLPMSNTAVILCGGRTQGQSIAEADAMYSCFQRFSACLSEPFPESRILIENRSLNTLQNMHNAAEILCSSAVWLPPTPNQLPINVILLSNDYHLERILEIQTLMDEQGLLRVLKSRCASMGIELNISLDINNHISVPYPHHGVLAEAFLLLDELTTYRVYLEGVTHKVFRRDLSAIKMEPLRIAERAIENLQALPLESEVLEQIEEIRKAIIMTASTNKIDVANQALDKLHPILTLLNRTIDPDSVF